MTYRNKIDKKSKMGTDRPTDGQTKWGVVLHSTRLKKLFHAKTQRRGRAKKQNKKNKQTIDHQETDRKMYKRTDRLTYKLIDLPSGS